MGTGLLVTELMGQGVNGVTGDYSRGAAGFWVENGQIQYPVAEITIAGNLKEMFFDIAAIGNDVDKRGGGVNRFSVDQSDADCWSLMASCTEPVVGRGCSRGS